MTDVGDIVYLEEGPRRVVERIPMYWEKWDEKGQATRRILSYALIIEGLEKEVK